MLVVILAGLGYGGYVLARAQLDRDHRQEAVAAFVAAWARGDHAAMYELVDAPSRRANPRISFLADYRRANEAAGVEKIRIGRVGPLLSGGRVRVPVTVTTEDFGTLRGTITFKASEENDAGRVAWTPALVLPGLKPGE